MATETHRTLCRFCGALCPVIVTIEDGVPVKIIGDKNDPSYFGFSCVKGRALPEQHMDKCRLLQTQKRNADGSHSPIDSGQAMDEIAEKIQSIVKKHGPAAVAIYIGTYSGPYPAGSALAASWITALGSPMMFTSMTIDQPAKPIASAMHGKWLGGAHHFDNADTYMLVGTNPVITFYGAIPCGNPSHRLHLAKQRDLKLIVIDPRETDVAKKADIFIQPKPGMDSLILSAMLNVIINEGLFDKDFVTENVQNFDELKSAVTLVSPEFAAEKADVPAEKIIEAARTFANGKQGSAQGGTGANMSGQGNLTEYLLLCLNTLCGRWNKEGEIISNPGVTMPPAIPKAQPTVPMDIVSGFYPLRTRGLSQSMAGLPTAALADEILTEGEGQIKALICNGSNPMNAWPDQLKTEKALDKLELLVTTDIQMSATAKVADYVFAPKLSFEAPATHYPVEVLEEFWPVWGLGEPYGHYAPALMDPPPNSDLIEEWELYYGLAQRMGLQLSLHDNPTSQGVARMPRSSVDMDMENKPSSDEMLALLMRDSRIPFDTLKHNPPQLYPEDIRVAPRDSDCNTRLNVGHPEMITNIKSLCDSAKNDGDDFPFHMISRRMINAYNSAGHYIQKLHPKQTYNPAYMHPEDLAELGLSPGDEITIDSGHATIPGIVAADDSLRRGLISMSHGWGDSPEHDTKFRTIGSNTSRLSNGEKNFDPHSGMPVMSNIPVKITPLDSANI